MDALKAIFSRRSVRKYHNDKVSDDDINTLIKAAMHAPSAGNQRAWHFIVIQDREILDAVPEFHPHAKFLKDISTAILVCVDLNLELERFKNYWAIDSAAATQNILLAAHSQGLGACWIGIYPREQRIEKLKEMLNLPESVLPFSLISIGYAAEDKPEEDFFNKERIHYNKW